MLVLLLVFKWIAKYLSRWWAPRLLTALRSQFAPRNCSDENRKAVVLNCEAPGHPRHTRFVVGGEHPSCPGTEFGWKAVVSISVHTQSCEDLPLCLWADEMGSCAAQATQLLCRTQMFGFWGSLHRIGLALLGENPPVSSHFLVCRIFISKWYQYMNWDVILHIDTYHLVTIGLFFLRS